MSCSGVVKRQSWRVTSHDLAIAVRLLLQSTMSSIVKASLAYIEEGSQKRSRDTKRAFQSLKKCKTCLKPNAILLRQKLHQVAATKIACVNGP